MPLQAEGWPEMEPVVSPAAAVSRALSEVEWGTKGATPPATLLASLRDGQAVIHFRLFKSETL